MHTRLRKSGLGWLVLVLLLSGCNSDWTRRRERSDEVYLTAPSNYRADVLAFMRAYLNDPVGVRDAFISEPSKRTLENVERYTVCLRYNARKSGGQYAGAKEGVAIYVSGKLDRFFDGRLEVQELCKGAVYAPFPELEALTR